VDRQREAAWRAAHRIPFDLERYGDLLVAILDEVQAAPELSEEHLSRILRRHPLPDGNILSKSQILRGYAQLCE